MKPTNNLRFVKRTVPIEGAPYSPHGSFGRVVQILQQMWESEPYDENSTVANEWRDVPVEEV
jgi:hypothetical protein